MDPIVITTQDLEASDFIGTKILRILPVETIEGLRYSEPGTMKLVNGHNNKSPISNGKAPSTDGIAVLMLTSGSTGNAKAVCLTHKQIFAAIRGKQSCMPLPADSAVLNWIAMDHVASLVEIHLFAMFAGIHQVHVPAVEVIENPILFLRLLCEHRVSRTFAPNFFLSKLQGSLEAASPQETKDIKLGNLLYIASGGEPNNVETCARVTDHLIKLGVANKYVITPGFGMTETCAGVIFNRRCPDVDIRTGREFAALGECVPGIEMRISATVDCDSESSTPMTTGTLELRGPIVFERYFNDEESTRAAFTEDGWFTTGDLATISPCGNLSLVGRSKELIIINGVKYLPNELESTIIQARLVGVNAEFVVCFAHHPPGAITEEVYVVYQHTYPSNDPEARMNTLQLLIRTVVLFTGARPRVLPLPPGRLEKTTLGKLSRSKTRNLLVGGNYKDQEDLDCQMLQLYRDAHFCEPENDLERELIAVFVETLHYDKLEMVVGVDTPILNTGVTSVGLIRLKSACEKAFDIAEIPIITIMTNTTIRTLASAIKQLQKSSQYEKQYNPIVTLQHNGSKTPLWLIHPGIGEILVFLGLAQYFPDRPIHALRTRGFNPGERPFSNLTDVVATYYHAMKQKQPHGPYALAGYSYGSMLAFEISKILEGNGETVSFLGSFNLPPHIKERMRMLDWTAGLLHIAHFCGIITELRSEDLVEELRELPKEEKVAKLLAESDQQRCIELALTHKSLFNWTNVAWSLQKIGWEYDPSGTVSHMDIFYCQPLKIVARTREEYRTTKLIHWAEFVRNDVKFHEVDGEHYTMIGPDHVPKFQQTLKKALAARGL